MKVLVVEDNEADYFLLRKHLQATLTPVEVHPQLASVQEAVHVLQHHRFDVVLLDLHLTDASGAEAVDQVAAHTPSSPLIILSGLDDERLVLSLLQKGAQDYIRKDQLTPALIRKVILHSIERQQMRTSLQQLAQRYQHVMQAAVDVVFDYDLHSQHLQVDRLHQHGQAQYNFEATHPAALLSPLADAAKMAELFQLFTELTNSDLTHYRQKLSLGNGATECDVELVCSVIRNKLGQPTRLVGSFADISELEQAGREAYAARMQYNHLFANSPAPSFVFDRQTLTILDCSKSASELYGFSKEDFLNCLVTDLWDEPELVTVTKLLLAQRFEALASTYHTHVTATGKKITVSLEVIQSSMYEREVYHLVAFDQSEKLQLERQLAGEQIEAQKQLSKSIIEAQESERTRIGQELHDNVNQMLTSALLYLKLNTNPSMHANKATDIVRKTIDEIRDLSHTLVTPVINDFGFVPAMEEFVAQLNSCQGICFQFFPDVPDLTDRAFLLNLYRIIQEQALNTIKHSKAAHCWITLTEVEDALVLCIEDDGKGGCGKKHSKGIGLQNIESRVQLYGGTLEIGDRKAGGFRMEATIPRRL